MNSQSLDFKGTIAQNYEDLLGSFLFEPFALDLIGRLDFSKAEKILELACGSGRVTKHIADNLKTNASFIASDLNADMIAVAKTKVFSSNVEWSTVDMLKIPYQDNQFDLIVCQFGIMLVPDPFKALIEILRVLKKGGKLLFTTWADIADNKLWEIGNVVLNSFLKKHPISEKPGPFAMSDEQAVIELIKSAGYNNVAVTHVSKIGEIETAAKAANGFIHGLPVISFIQQQEPSLLPKILQTFEDSLKNYLGDNPLKVSQKALVFEAVK